MRGVDARSNWAAHPLMVAILVVIIYVRECIWDAFGKVLSRCTGTNSIRREWPSPHNPAIKCGSPSRNYLVANAYRQAK